MDLALPTFGLGLRESTMAMTAYGDTTAGAIAIVSARLGVKKACQGEALVQRDAHKALFEPDGSADPRADGGEAKALTSEHPLFRASANPHQSTSGGACLVAGAVTCGPEIFDMLLNNR